MTLPTLPTQEDAAIVPASQAQAEPVAMPRHRLPRNMITQFMRGLSYPFDALLFIRKHRLWPLCGAAVAIHAVLLLGLLWVWLATATPWLESLEVHMMSWADDRTWLDTLFQIAIALVWITVLLVGLAGTGVAVLMVGQAVASPFLDALSERVECIVLGRTEHPFRWSHAVSSVIVAVGDLIGAVVFLCVVHVPILLMALTGVGAFFVPIASFVASTMLLAHEFVGLPLARNLLSYRKRWRVVLRFRWMSMGLGTSMLFFLAVPFVDLLLLPLAAVAGTLMFCDLSRAGALEETLRHKA